MRRIALAFAIAACASPAFAVQDRYGPPRTESPTAGVVQLPPGALLDWSGKAAPQPAQPGPPALARPEPLAPWAQRMAPRPTQAPAPIVQPQAAVAPAAIPAARQQPALPLPPQQARALPVPANGPRPYVAQPYVAQPYVAQAMAAPPPVATAQAPGAAARPRFYSVARQYGAQPDPIPVSAAPRGPALSLTEIPASDNLGRTQAPLDDGRSNQAVVIPDTKQNAASNRISRLGL